MKCMNCSAELQDNAGRLVAQTFVCVDCSKLISKLRARVVGEIEGLLARLDSVLRYTITNHGVNETFVDRRLGTADVLKFWVQADAASVEEMCRNTEKMIPSTESSQLSVSTADGKRSSPKLSAVD